MCEQSRAAHHRVSSDTAFIVVIKKERLNSKLTVYVSTIKMDSLLDSITAMRHQEGTGYETCDYLSFQPLHLSNDVDADCRTKMADWCIQVNDFCKFQHETAEIAMNILDRYVAADGSALRDRSTYQLAAMTCLYLAVKVHEPEAMDPATISVLSRGTYTPDDVEDVERHILESIQWRVNPPTSVCFTHYLLQLLPHDALTRRQFQTVQEIATIQLEVAMRDYELITVKRSSIAYCALVNALQSLHVVEPKVLTCMKFILTTALGIDGNDNDIYDLTTYLCAATEQLSAASITEKGLSSSAIGAAVKRAPMQRRASFEISPRSTVLIR